MRIALILPGFSAHPNDWAIPALLNLARSLAPTHELHIFSQRYPAAGRYHFDGFTHHALGGGQKFGPASLKIWLQSAQAVVAQHQRTPFDLLHAFWADEAGFSAALAGSKLNRPVIVSLGGGELSHLPDIGYGAQRFLARRLTTRLALRRANRVTTGSVYQLNLARGHGVSETKLRLAPLGVDTALFRPGSGEGGRLEGWKIGEGEIDHRPVIIQAASLLPVKNQGLLFETLALVSKEMPGVRLNLVGTGPLQAELEGLAETLKIGHHINWRRAVAYPAMAATYQQAQLYVQTSRHESQGMAVLEAMACGLPVLGTPVGVAAEVACLSAASTAEDLADQVIKLFSNRDQYRAASRQARQIIEHSFSLAVTTARFQKIYSELLA